MDVNHACCARVSCQYDPAGACKLLLRVLHSAQGNGPGMLLANNHMKYSQEELDAAKIPYSFRDYCAHLLLPLNDCRRDNWYMPWACGHEKHVYEKCQYKEFKRRVAIMVEEKRRSGAAV